MKKIYISPSLVTVTLSARRQIMLSGSPTSDIFIQEDATGEAMTKGVISDRNVWDNEW